MSQVEYEENNTTQHFQSRVILGIAQTPKMVDFIMKCGVADEKRAGHILVAIIVACIIAIAAIVNIFVFKDSSLIYRDEIPQSELETIPPELLRSIPTR